MIIGSFFQPTVIVVSIVFLALLAFTILCIWMFATQRNSYGETSDEWGMGAIFSSVLTLIAAVIVFIGILPPYDVSFYKVYQIEGEIQEIEETVSADGSTLSKVFIIEMDGIDLYIISDDQRLKMTSVGDSVSLVCEKQFRYFIEPWYDCSVNGAITSNRK